jgi:hypothetical protein
MSEVYDFRSISFLAHSGTAVVTGTVPDVMVGVIAHAKYVSAVPEATIFVKLLQTRAGTVTGTLDAAVLTPQNSMWPAGPGKIDNIIAVVDPGHRVEAHAEAGSVIGVILFGYAPGRMRRP